jgi:copper chaperone CopZ
MKGKTKIGVLVGVLAVAIIMSISYVAAKNSKDGSAIADNTKDLTETTLQVSNLSCGSCLSNIEAELSKSAGMAGMSADLGKGLVAIRHTDELSPEKIASIITGIGYPAKVLVSQASNTKAPSVLGDPRAASGCSGCGPRGCGLTPPQPSPEKS